MSLERHSILDCCHYAYTDDGKLWSSKRGPWKEIGTGRNQGGYFVCTLSDSKAEWTTYVHRVIAHAVLGECPPGMTVDHINQKRWDNRPCNLQYATRKEQVAHLDRWGEKNPRCKLSDVAVQRAFKLREQGLLQREIAVILEVTQANISSILTGKTRRLAWQNQNQ